MKYKDIKKLAKNKKKVYWSNFNYLIIYDDYADKFLIHSLCNNHYIELKKDYCNRCFQVIKEA